MKANTNTLAVVQTITREDWLALRRPDGSEATSDLLKKMFPVNRGDNVLVPLYGKEPQLQQIIELENQIKELEKSVSSLKQELQLDIGDADGGKANGFFVWWRAQSRVIIDAQKLKREMPVIHEQFARTSNFRKFEIKISPKEVPSSEAV